MFNYPRGKGPKERLNGDSIKRKRGRPKGTGLSPEPTVRSVRVTELVSVMLEDWKKDYHADTLDEAIRKYVKDHGQLRKKVEALEVELRRPYLSRSNNIMEKEVNESLQVIQT